MPFAGYKDFADCVRKNKGKNNPKAYCASIKRKVEKEAKKSIRYMMPFTLKEATDNEAIIHGLAVKATTSLNNVTYTVEGLKNNNTLNGMNIGIGHTGNPADNVGKIIETNWDEGIQGRRYRAKIFNTARYPDAIEMVKRGLWQFVSLEAIPLDAKMEGKGKKRTLKVNELIFTGLDFVKSPGIQQASAALAGESFGTALFEALKIEESKMSEEEKKEVEEKVRVVKQIVEKIPEDYDELRKFKESVLKEKHDTLLKEAKELGIEGVGDLPDKALEKLIEKVKTLEEKSKAIIQENVKKQETNLIFESGGGAGLRDFWVMPKDRMPQLAE